MKVILKVSEDHPKGKLRSSKGSVEVSLRQEEGWVIDDDGDSPQTVFH